MTQPDNEQLLREISDKLDPKAWVIDEFDDSNKPNTIFFGKPKKSNIDPISVIQSKVNITLNGGSIRNPVLDDGKQRNQRHIFQETETYNRDPLINYTSYDPKLNNRPNYTVQIPFNGVYNNNVNIPGASYFGNPGNRSYTNQSYLPESIQGRSDGQSFRKNDVSERKGGSGGQLIGSGSTNNNQSAPAVSNFIPLQDIPNNSRSTFKKSIFK